jgi:acetoacetyl-CoA synthetase
VTVLWSPDGRDSALRRFAERQGFGDFDALQRWSVTDLEEFWRALADFFGIELEGAVLASREMPGAEWFPGATLNYVEYMLRDGDEPAVLARSQSREPFAWTRADLREQVRRARADLRALGVTKGARVAAYLPNIPETLAYFLGAASLGATWASVSPEFGPRSVIDRFAQIEPKVLLAVDRYTHRGKEIDRRGALEAIRAAVPAIVVAPELPETDEPLQIEPVAFDHPLYILFSSGTTGLPKPIVHGHGGILLEHHKNLGLTWDIGPGSRLLQPTTTAWMMWNALVSALMLGGSIVLFDGDAAWPELDELWRVAEETQATIVGVSPAYLMACRKAGVTIPEGRIDRIATAGSPLPPEGYDYVYEQLGPDVLLINGSGGTDVCSAIVSGCPLLPVVRGEIAGRCLGVDTAAFDLDGNEVVGELGELVIRQPMPSMPVSFWGDDGSRYRAAYFDAYPGVWRQGDWVRFSEQGTCVITGRSDATLNRGGVRMGTSELYAVVEELPEVQDSLVVHLEDDEGGPGELLLFVVCEELDDELRERIARELREQLSPRHVPDTIAAVQAIPRTLTGKKLEAPVKRILRGAEAESVASRGALADPIALDAFVQFSEGMRRER